jgi:hypothetical protein
MERVGNRLRKYGGYLREGVDGQLGYMSEDKHLKIVQFLARNVQHSELLTSFLKYSKNPR